MDRGAWWAPVHGVTQHFLATKQQQQGNQKECKRIKIKERQVKVKGENLLITDTWFSLGSFSKGKSWKVPHGEWCTAESQPSPGASFEQGFTWGEGEEEGEGVWCFPHLPVPLILSPANQETQSVWFPGVPSLPQQPLWEGSRADCPHHLSVWSCVRWAPLQHRAGLLSHSSVCGGTDISSCPGGQTPWWCFFPEARTDLAIETFTVTCLIIFCTEILSHNVACFPSSKPLRLCCASKWDQQLNLSLLLMQTHNYGQSAEREVRLPFSVLTGMTRRQLLWWACY